MVVEKFSMGSPDRSAVAREVSNALVELGGPGPFKVAVGRIRKKLNWWDAAASNRIRHLIRFEQKPSAEQVEEIRRAKTEADRAQNLRLIASFRTFIDTALSSDPKFFGPQVEVIREIIGELGGESGSPREPDRD